MPYLTYTQKIAGCIPWFVYLLSSLPLTLWGQDTTQVFRVAPKTNIQVLDTTLHFSTFQQTAVLRVGVNQLPQGQTAILKLTTAPGQTEALTFTPQQLTFTKAGTQAFQVKLNLPLGWRYDVGALQEALVLQQITDDQGMVQLKTLQSIQLSGVVYHWQFIGLIGLAILIVGIILFILWRKRKKKKEQANEGEGGKNEADGNEEKVASTKKNNVSKQNEALAEALKLFRELDFETKQKVRQQLQEKKTKELIENEGYVRKVYQAYKRLDKKAKPDFLTHTQELHNLEDFFAAIRKKMNGKSGKKEVEKLLQEDLPQLLTEGEQALAIEEKLAFEKKLLAEVDHTSTEDAKLLAILNFTPAEQQALMGLKAKNYQEFLKGFARHFSYEEKQAFYQAIQPQETNATKISSEHLTNADFQKAGENYYALFWCLKQGIGQEKFQQFFNKSDNLKTVYFDSPDEIQYELLRCLGSDQRIAQVLTKSKVLGNDQSTEAYWLWERYKLLSHQEQIQVRDAIQEITLEKFWNDYKTFVQQSTSSPNDFIKSFSESAYNGNPLKVTYYDKFTTADQAIIRLALLRQAYRQFSFAHKNIFYTYLTKGEIDLTQEAFFRPYQGLYLADDSTHQQNLEEWHQFTIAPDDLLDACKDLPSLGELETNQNYETQFRQFSLLSNEERKEFEALFEKEPDPDFTEEEFKDLQKRNAALENEVRNLQTQLKAKEPLTVVEDQGLKQENERLQTELKELQHKNASLAGLENQQSMWTNEKTRLEQELEEARASNANDTDLQLRQENEGLRLELKELQHKNASLAGLENQQSMWVNEKTRLENDLQALKDAKSQTDQELGRLRALEQTLNTSKTELDQQVLALQTQINEQDQQLQQLTTLEEEKEKLNALNNKLTDEKQVLAQNLANTEKELEKIGAELVVLQDEKALMLANRENLAKEVDILKNEKEQALDKANHNLELNLAELNALRGQQQEYKQNIAQKEEKISNLDAKVQRLDGDLDRVHQELNTTKAAHDNLAKQLADYQNQIDQQKDENNFLKEELQSREESLYAAQKERDTAQFEKRKLGRGFQQLNIDADNLDKRLKTLQLGELAYHDLQANLPKYQAEGAPPSFLAHFYYMLDNAYTQLTQVIAEMRSDSKFYKFIQDILIREPANEEQVPQPLFDWVRKENTLAHILGVEDLTMMSLGTGSTIKEQFLRKIFLGEAKLFIHHLGTLYCYSQTTHPDFNLVTLMQQDGIDTQKLASVFALLQEVLQTQFDTRILLPRLMTDDVDTMDEMLRNQYDFAAKGKLNNWFPEATQRIEPGIIFDLLRVGFHSDTYPFVNKFKPLVVSKA